MDILTGAIGGAIYAFAGAGKSMKAGEKFQADQIVVSVVTGAILGGIAQILNLTPESLDGMQFSVVLNMGVLYTFNKVKDMLGIKNVITPEKK